MDPETLHVLHHHSSHGAHVIQGNLYDYVHVKINFLVKLIEARTSPWSPLGVVACVRYGIEFRVSRAAHDDDHVRLDV